MAEAAADIATWGTEEPELPAPAEESLSAREGDAGRDTETPTEAARKRSWSPLTKSSTDSSLGAGDRGGVEAAAGAVRNEGLAAGPAPDFDNNELESEENFLHMLNRCAGVSAPISHEAPAYARSSSSSVRCRRTR